ncbi:MAG: ELWxxDGT repeat protein [Cyclobacteriaceae bacterium]
MSADNSSYPSNYLEVGGTVYFSATGPEGKELWKTDKTLAGTVLVKDISPGLSSSDPTAFFEFNGMLYFLANDGIYGVELWKSDGTDAGTVLVKDINPGSANGPSYCSYCGDAKSFIELNGKIYFTATDGVAGLELWETDGTEAGTQIAKDINPGVGNSAPSKYIFYDNKIFFTVYLPSTGVELWTSDGTSGGTKMVIDLIPGSGSGGPNNLTVANGLLMFSAQNGVNDNELYGSDGTEQGTQLVADINPASSSSPNLFTVMDGNLYFYANDGINGQELWKSDGTTLGTVLVKDIEPGANGSYADKFAVANGVMYMRIHTSAYGSELWKSDGTEAGTMLVKDIIAGSGAANVYSVTNAGGTIYFSVSVPGAGRELWKSDGTEIGTIQIKDINSGNADSNPSGFVALGGEVIFTATGTGTGTEVWISDGTEGGTHILKDIVDANKGSVSGYYKKVGSNVFFTADDGISGNELWITDGTEVGTTMVKDLNSGSSDSYFNYLTDLNGLLIFQANNGLWRSDGTEAGTYQIMSGNGSYEMVTVGSNVYLNWYDPTNGFQLWKSDGTVPGTILVKDIDPSGTNSTAQGMTNVNGTLFFHVNDGVHGSELWKSDGTEPGTVMVKEIVPGTSSDYSFRLFAFGSTLLFYVNDGVDGSELWKSDGTDAGTVLVKDIYPGSTGSFFANEGVILNGEFFFSAYSPNGRELWKTDGTEIGTVMVKDIVPGSADSAPTNLMLINNSVVFATLQNSKFYLWKSDGTEMGTELVTDFSSFSFINSIQQPNSGSTIGYFLINQGSVWQPWRTDGTAEGTFAVTTETSNLMTIIGTDDILINVKNTLIGNELYKYTPEVIEAEIKVLRSYNEFQTSDSYDFGTVETLANSDGVGFAIVNTGNAALLINSLTITGANASDFVINQNGTVSKVNPGVSTTFSITFSPSAFGPREATLTIQSSDVDEGAFVINLTGEGGPISQTISFSALSNKTYGGNDFNLSATASSTLNVIYASSNVNVATVLDNTVTIVGAGNTNITASQAGDGTYLPADDVMQPLLVEKLDLVAKGNGESRVYGDSNPTFTIGYTIFANGDDENDIDVPPTTSTLADITSDAGEYDIEVAGGSDNNYNIVIDANKGKLTVNKRDLVLKANSESRAYGDANPSFTIAYTTFVNGDIEGDLDVLPIASTTTNLTSNAGDYDIEVTGGIDNNYHLIPDVTKGILTVGKRDLVIKANGISKTYGDANPSFAISYTSFVNDDVEGDLDVQPTATTVADETSIVGNYDIEVAGGSDNNYNLVPDATAGELTVTKRDLVAKAGDQSKTYGEANPTFAIDYTGFINGDDVDDLDILSLASTTADEMSSTGTYDIDVSGGDDNNYSIIPDATKGILTIGKRNLIVKANDVGKTHGDSNPTFTLAFSAFINGDEEGDLDIAPVASTIADASSDVGTYDIDLVGGSDNNYSIVPDATKGILTIAKAAQSIMFDVLPDKYLSDPSFSLVATASSGLSVSYSSSNPSVATVLGSEVTLVGPGTTTITAMQLGDQNYLVATEVEQPMNITILQSVSFDPIVSKTFGDAPFSLDATASSGLEVEYMIDNNAVAMLSGNTVTIVGAGIAIITASQSGNNDYEPASSVEQTLIVNTVDQIITFSSINDKEEGGAPFTLVASASSGLNVTYASTSDNVTLSGDQVTLVAPGRVTIAAAQHGDNNFQAAATVEQSFCINPAVPSITVDLSNITTPVLTSSALVGNQWYLDGDAIVNATDPTYTVESRGTYLVSSAVDDCVSELSAAQAFVVTGDELPYVGNTQIKIFPNPVEHTLVIRLGGFDSQRNVNVNMIDGLGRTLMTTSGVGGEELNVDVHEYTPGIYFVQMSQGEQIHQVRFIKK